MCCRKTRSYQRACIAVAIGHASIMLNYDVAILSSCRCAVATVKDDCGINCQFTSHWTDTMSLSHPAIPSHCRCAVWRRLGPGWHLPRPSAGGNGGALAAADGVRGGDGGGHGGGAEAGCSVEVLGTALKKHSADKVYCASPVGCNDGIGSVVSEAVLQHGSVNMFHEYGPTVSTAACHTHTESCED